MGEVCDLIGDLLVESLQLITSSSLGVSLGPKVLSLIVLLSLSSGRVERRCLREYFRGDFP
jgi:hypothetical protein